MAKKKLRGPWWGPEWTFAYDMIAETMTDAERRAMAKKLLERVKANRQAFCAGVKLTQQKKPTELHEECLSFIGAGWETRTDQLYAAAAEVAKTLGVR